MKFSSIRVQILPMCIPFFIVTLHLFLVPSVLSLPPSTAAASSPVQLKDLLQTGQNLPSSERKSDHMPAYLERVYEEVADDHGRTKAFNGNRLAADAGAIWSYGNKATSQPVAKGAHFVALRTTFRLEKRHRRSSVIQAELRLFKPRGGVAGDKQVLLRVNVSEWRQTEFTMMTSRVTSASRGGWESFNLTNLVGDRYRRKGDIRLMVTIEDASGSVPLSVREQRKYQARLDAFLVVYIGGDSEETTHSHRTVKRASQQFEDVPAHFRKSLRSKNPTLPILIRKERASGFPEIDPMNPTEIDGSGTTGCKLQPVVVKFSDLGQTNIVRPSEFPLNDCVGSCSTVPSLKRYHGSKHAILRGVYYSRQSIAKKPCCVPTKFAPIYVALIDKQVNAYAVIKWNQVEAINCGCR
eukprot:m.310616 g.310616  ORF g.310616 m.310616 type:complete len:410 (+) comp53229_c0_seq1:283-1512(+)